jgi:hypothetical protein
MTTDTLRIFNDDEDPNAPGMSIDYILINDGPDHQNNSYARFDYVWDRKKLFLIYNHCVYFWLSFLEA